MSLSRTRHFGLLTALLLYGATNPLRAQQAAPPPATAPAYWYLGPQLGVQARVYNVDRMGNGLTTHVLGLRGGYALNDRLAIEAGVQYGKGAQPDDELRGSGQFAYYPQTEQVTRAWVVPATLRWSLARQPHRFGVSALLGASLCLFELRETGTNTATGAKFVKRSDAVNGFLDFGLGAQLRASRRLNVTLDVVPNLNLQTPNNAYWPIAPGLNTVLALNYRLN